MERKFLEDLGLEKEVINQIMDENGKDITKAKSDYKEIKTQLTKANETIKERDKQIEKLNEVDGEKLKEEITKLQKLNKEAERKYLDDLKELKLNNAIKLAIHDKVFNEDMAAGLFDKSKLVLTDDGEVVGIEQQLEGIKKDNAFLFKTGEVKNNYKPSSGEPSSSNPFSKDTFNLTEQGKLIQSDPVRAKELASVAGVTLNI